MLQKDKLKEAVKLLRSVSDDWDETLVESYPPELPSFDELVDSISCIVINNPSPTKRVKEVLIESIRNYREVAMRHGASFVDASFDVYEIVSQVK
jgi:hypothetical protein